MKTLSVEQASFAQDLATPNDGAAVGERSGVAHGRAPLVLLAAVLACYLLAHFVFGRFPDYDEIFYKAAGFHWATDGRFAAPELIGRLPFDPPIEQIFAAYPPVYPFLFGVYAKVFGFGWQSVSTFDALVHVGLCVVAAMVVIRLLPTASAWVAALAGMFVIPLGSLGRPDELAMLFAMIACWLMLGALNWRSLTAIAIAWGLCAATSAGTAVLLCPIGCSLFLLSKERIQHSIGRLMFILVASLLTLFLCVLPLVWLEPRALRQFLDHSESAATTAPLLHGLLLAWTWGKFKLMPVLSAAAAVLLLLPALRRAGLMRDAARICGGALVSLAACIIAMQAKYTYVWFFGPWLIASVFVLAAMVWRSRSARPWAVSAIAVMLLGGIGGSVPFVFDSMLLVMMPQDQRFPAAAARVQAAIPAGATVLADEHWVTLANQCRIYDARFAGPEILPQVDYVVLTGNRAGGIQRRPLRPAFEAYFDAHFVVASDDLARRPVTFLGRRITNSAYGFGVVILERVR